MYTSRNTKLPTGVFTRALAAAALTLGLSSVALAPYASASVAVHAGATQRQLEQEINTYASLLGQLGSEIERPTIAAAHRQDLDALSTAATQDVNNLVAKVQIDTTPAEIAADAAAISKLKVLFAVLAPQVFETVEADDEQQQYNALYLDRERLKPLLPILKGSAGYNNALGQFQNLVASINAAEQILTHIATDVLTQRASGYPGNASVFSKAASNLQAVQVDLSRAAHDEEILGLAFGGYKGN